MAPLLIGLKSDFLRGPDPLKAWCARANKAFSGLQISNIYRVQGARMQNGWLSELWAVASVDCALIPDQLEEKLAELTKDLPVVSLPLLWGQEVLLNPGLPLPHPDLHRNSVFLQCASEIQPNLKHPILGQTLIERLNEGGNSAELEFYAQGRHIFE